jgi:pimeloyl-ACP methyl ester carboxylesterase
MEAGLGDSGPSTWEPIFAQVSAMSRTLVYDRAGLGGSTPGPEPRTSEQIVTELRTLLAAIAFEPPYIVVGHSIAGVHMRVFASRFPEEIAGLVFVDASHEHYFTEWQARFPEIFAGWQRENDSRLAAFPGALAEWKGMQALLPAFGMPVPLPDVPAAVLTGLRLDPPSGIYTAEFNTAANEWWFDAHEMLTGSLPRGTHVASDRSGHYIHHDEPELVIEAIRQVLAAAREPAPEGVGVAGALGQR